MLFRIIYAYRIEGNFEKALPMLDKLTKFIGTKLQVEILYHRLLSKDQLKQIQGFVEVKEKFVPESD